MWALTKQTSSSVERDSAWFFDGADSFHSDPRKLPDYLDFTCVGCG